MTNPAKTGALDRPGVMRQLGSESGVALMMTLWVLTLLTIIAAEFAFSVKTDVTAARNSRDGQEAYFIARGMVDTAIEEILRPSDIHALAPNGEVVFLKQPVSAAPNQPVSLPFIPDTAQRNGIPLALGTGGYRIVDEDRKIGLNTIAADRGQLAAFLASAGGMEQGSALDTVADSIMDWVDSDDLYRLNGAEKEYYSKLSPPYQPRNAPFASVAELAMVRGITPELYRRLAPKLTIFSGTAINDNTADSATLASLGKTPEQIAQIMDLRAKQGYASAAKSQYFRIVATGSVSGGSATAPVMRSVEAVVQKINDREAVIRSWNDDFTGQ